MNDIKLGILPDLTKNYILERITEEEIMEFYTGIPVCDESLSSNAFLSPLRNEEHPSCNYYYTDYNKLKLRDFGVGFNGDIFDVVGAVNKINVNNAQGFVLVLNIIAKDFGIHKYTKQEEVEKLNKTLEDHIQKKSLTIIKIHPRKFNRFDNLYWGALGISEEMVRLAKIIPVDSLELQGYDGYFYTRYRYHSSNPAYAYYGGKENGINIWKVYFPYSKDKKRKFISNRAFIQLEHLLQPAEVGLITKSLKDALCYKSFGIQAAGIPSETSLLTPLEKNKITSYFNITASNMDYDKAGIKMANKLKYNYNIPPLMFTRGKYNQIDYGVKDFSEFILAYGRDKARSLLLRVIDKHREDLNKINQYNYESLSWINQK